MTNAVRGLSLGGGSNSMPASNPYLTLETIQYCEEKVDEKRAASQVVEHESLDLQEELNIKRFYENKISSPHILYKVGSGVFGMVFKVQYKNGAVGALKCSKIERANYITEEAKLIQAISEAAIPNMVSYENSFKDEEYGRSMIFLSYHSLTLAHINNTLSTNDTHLAFADVKGIGYDIFSGLFHLADKLKLAHLDIKPDNLLVDTTKGKLSVKIADFGLAQNFTTNPYIRPLEKQSLQYRSPHVLTGKAKDNDIFSVGAVIAEVVTRKMLFGFDIKALSNENRPISDAELMRGHLNRVFSLVGEPSSDFINEISYFTKLVVYEGQPISYKTTECMSIKELVLTARKELNEPESELLELSRFIESTLEYENPKSLEKCLKDPFLSPKLEKIEKVASSSSVEASIKDLTSKKRQRSDSSNSLIEKKESTTQ